LIKTSAGVKRWVAGKKQRDGGKAKRAVIGVMRRLAMAAYQVGACGVAFDAERLFSAGSSRVKVALAVVLMKQRSFFSRERRGQKA